MKKINDEDAYDWIIHQIEQKKQVTVIDDKDLKAKIESRLGYYTKTECTIYAFDNGAVIRLIKEG